MTKEIIAYDLSPAFQARCAYVDTLPLADVALDLKRQDALAAVKVSQDITVALDAMHFIQRVYLAGKLDILDKPDILIALKDEEHFPTWKNYASLDVAQEKKDILARQLYEGHAPIAPLVLFIGDYVRGIAEGTLAYCVDNKDQTDVWVDDRLFSRRIMLQLDEAGVRRYGELLASRYDGTKRRIVTFADYPSVEFIDPMPPAEMEDLRQTTFMKIMEETGLWLGQKFTGSILPSRHEAKQDGIPFDEYIDIFFNMCAIDPKKIAVAHEALIGILNAGSTVHITNNDGTDVTFGIEGMTFENSLMDYNIPGTEVFSSPQREKVNGRIVAKGLFAPPLAEDNIIRDITLEFKDGRIVHYDAAEGLEHLRAQIEKDEGSHFLGELAFGTNPELTRHVTNGLLVEKIGGSFHVAIGRAYGNTPDAIIDNGNKSMVHWDITTMLVGKDGMVAVDGEVIMRGGLYLDPRLAFLNGANK